MAGRDFKDNGMTAWNRLKARPMADLDTRKRAARAWFEDLAARIIAVFEALEDEADTRNLCRRARPLCPQPLEDARPRPATTRAAA